MISSQEHQHQNSNPQSSSSRKQQKTSTDWSLTAGSSTKPFKKNHSKANQYDKFSEKSNFQDQTPTVYWTLAAPSSPYLTRKTLATPLPSMPTAKISSVPMGGTSLASNTLKDSAWGFEHPVCSFSKSWSLSCETPRHCHINRHRSRQIEES